MTPSDWPPLWQDRERDQFSFGNIVWVWRWFNPSRVAPGAMFQDFVPRRASQPFWSALLPLPVVQETRAFTGTVNESQKVTFQFQWFSSARWPVLDRCQTWHCSMRQRCECRGRLFDNSVWHSFWMSFNFIRGCHHHGLTKSLEMKHHINLQRGIWNDTKSLIG